MRLMIALPVLLLPVILCSCGDGTADKTDNQIRKIEPAKGVIGDAVWLTGTWRDAQDGDVTREVWRMEGGVLAGTSSTTGEDGPPFSEVMRIEPRNGTLVFVVRVNDEPAVEFTATTITSDELLFENPAHDFPQRILYQRVTADSIYARVDGSSEDEGMISEYFYSRVR